MAPMPALAPTRATALASTLATFRGWHLLAHCAHCKAMRLLPVTRLIEQVGEAALFADVLPRLRCQRCGEAPPAVKLSEGGGPSAREVWVMGSP